MILIILHLPFIKFLKYLFTVLMIEREGRGTMKSRMRCERERDKWIENLKLPWKRMLEEERDFFLAL